MKYGLGFLTKKEKNQLIDSISQSLIKWCKEWTNSNIVPEIQIEEYSQAHHKLLNIDLYCLNDRNPVVGFLNDDTDTWVNILFKDINFLVPHDTLTTLLIESAKKDLLNRVNHGDSFKDDSGKLINISDINFSGIPVIAHIHLASESFELLLDSNFLNDNDFNLSHSTVEIKCVDEVIVDIKTQFILDKLSVSEFIDIQVGDVIKSNHRIVQPFSVSCNGNEIALASLGQAENHRAILLT